MGVSHFVCCSTPFGVSIDHASLLCVPCIGRYENTDADFIPGVVLQFKCAFASRLRGVLAHERVCQRTLSCQYSGIRL